MKRECEEFERCEECEEQERSRVIVSGLNWAR
jgi:hypothetical protein